ncbi:MAG: hypothetical protein AAB570_01640 [Patescibacteria group bacterium]
MTSNSQQPCRICSKLPDTITVDTDQGESIPKELDTLESVGGQSTDAFGALRQCPECHQYYRYWYSHEVTTGGGLGWSEHTLTKITNEHAADQLHQLDETPSSSQD